MRVQDVMWTGSACCTPDTNLQDAARMLRENECDAVAVIESREIARPLGVLTHHDIICRAVASGKNPLELTVRDCMSFSHVLVTAATTVEKCGDLMEQHHVNRVAVVDELGSCVGVVSEMDIVLKASPDAAPRFVRRAPMQNRPCGDPMPGLYAG